MTGCLRLILALTLIPTLHAGTIEVAQWMPWDFIKSELIPESIGGSGQQDLLELELGEYKPKLHQLNVELQGQVGKSEFNHEGVSSEQKLSIKIEIARVEIDQMIERVINGNVIRVHIKAQCRPFSIRIPNVESSVFLTYQFQNFWKPSLQNLTINIKENNWEISPVSCDGIDGLGAQIADELNRNLLRPDVFLPTLKSWLSEEISTRYDTLWTSLLQNSNASLASIDRPTDKGIMIHGLINIQNNRNVVIKLPEEASLSNSVPQFVMSQEGFEALMEDKILGFIPKDYNLQEVAGFKKLIKSRFLQFFVWPDLKRFNSSTPFILTTDHQKTKLSLTPGASGFTAFLNTHGILKTVLGDAEIDYINYALGIKADLKVNVKDGKLILTSTAPSIELAWSFGLLYQMLFKPTKRISTDVLKEAILPFFQNRSVETELPTIKLHDREWKLQNWKQHNDIITMDWL